MKERIGEYRPLTPPMTAGSGSARWCIAARGGQRFFVKQFLSPVYPAVCDSLLRQKQRERCHRFERRKQQLYSAMSCVIGETLVPVLDFFRFEGRYYAVSEVVQTEMNGESRNDLTEAEKRQVLYHLALCLQRLHLQQIVHADLKPEHILLIPDNWGYTVRLIDLDSGFLFNDPPSPGSGLEGDPVYLSPEAFLRMTGQDVPLTAAVDSFALGAIIHRIWTGELPGFDRSRFGYLYEAVLSGESPEVSKDMPDQMRWLVQELLSAEPERRPDDAACVRILGDGLQPMQPARSATDEPLNSLSRFMKKR
ncbi:MAG: protein kinase [Clostridia bacterium]|nr:protein kinase [Clostridia bacterium]